MAEEKKSLFRKESLDRISSPEDYDQYLRVTGPGVWIVLAAVVVLLAGALVWAFFGRLNTNMDALVVSDGSAVYCVFPASSKDSVSRGEMKIEIGGTEYTLTDTGLADQVVTADGQYAELISCGLEAGTEVSSLQVDAALAAGVYTGSIRIEKVSPIYFILN